MIVCKREIPPDARGEWQRRGKEKGDSRFHGNDKMYGNDNGNENDKMDGNGNFLLLILRDYSLNNSFLAPIHTNIKVKKWTQISEGAKKYLTTYYQKNILILLNLRGGTIFCHYYFGKNFKYTGNPKKIAKEVCDETRHNYEIWKNKNN